MLAAPGATRAALTVSASIMPQLQLLRRAAAACSERPKLAEVRVTTCGGGEKLGDEGSAQGRQGACARRMVLRPLPRTLFAPASLCLVSAQPHTTPSSTTAFVHASAHCAIVEIAKRSGAPPPSIAYRLGAQADSILQVWQVCGGAT